LLHTQEVAGSNPASRTTFLYDLTDMGKAGVAARDIDQGRGGDRHS